MTSEIVVVGAGVIGLTTALVLAENNYKVTIVAKHFPSDPLSSEYTSPWAGAHFRPFPSRSASDERERNMTRVTQEHFKKLSTIEPHSSVRFVEGIEYFEAPDSYYSEIGGGYSDRMEEFKVLEQKELPQGVVLGTSYKTWVINSPHYIRYLQNQLAFRYGVQFHRCDLQSLQQVSKIFPKATLVNCSGRGLQFYGGYDPEGFLIRGQTLLVRAPPGCPYLDKTITHQSKDGQWTFVISRPLDGGIILGGTKQIGDTDPNPRPQDTQGLIERGRILYPKLFDENQELDVRHINVGFRPARKGGVRVEIERPTANCSVIHAYGAGGMGYELSYGMAQEVLELVRTGLVSGPKL